MNKEATQEMIRATLQAEQVEPLTEKQLTAVAALMDRYAEKCALGMQRLTAMMAGQDRRAA